MTRINSAIPVKSLIDMHLLAEHREIKRICFRFSERLKRNKFDDIPSKFVLGTGHELFFIDKPEFTLTRYKQIYIECLTRGFNVENYHNSWNVYGDSMFWKNKHIPTDEEYQLLIDRISERIIGTNKPLKYYGKSITTHEAIEILKQLKP